MAIQRSPNTQPSPASQIGGKGTIRRKIKRMSSNYHTAYDERRLADGLQKLGVLALPGASHATFFNRQLETVGSIMSPTEIFVSTQSGVLVIIGGEELPPEDTPHDVQWRSSESISMNKHEKKAHKLLMGLGSPQNHIQGLQVTTNHGMLQISDAVVSKLEGKSKQSYLVLGKVVYYDRNEENLRAKLSKTVNALASLEEPHEHDECPDLLESNSQSKAVGNEEPTAEDVALVMAQAQVSKKKAAAALQETGNDVVEAIMALSA